MIEVDRQYDFLATSLLAENAVNEMTFKGGIHATEQMIPTEASAVFSDAIDAKNDLTRKH